jgi:hypothetical protein
MAKKNRYRWQNEKKHNRAQNQSLANRNGWGSKLQFYELVSLHPLKYKKIR